MDFTSGYFQVPVREEDRHFLTFIVPQGKFRFKRLPMGLSASNCIFNVETDHIIRGEEKVVKSIDDVLGQASSATEAYQQMARVLTKLINSGMVVSKKKFQLGTKVTYGGFELSSDNNEGLKIAPDAKRMEAISK